MPKDENGIDPKAKDGEPNGKSKAQQVADDELAMRRARQEAREQEEEAATGMSDHPPGGKRGKRGAPIDDQPEPDPEEEMFPQGSIPGDDKVTMKNIVPAGKGRKTEAAMSRAAVPLRDGLVRYGELVELLVTVEAGKVEEVPDLERVEGSDRRNLLGVKDVQNFRVAHVRHAADLYTRDQVLDILEQRFGIPRSADKIAEVFGPVTAEQRAAAAAAG